ncbi:barrier-to-autointegration factor B [Esox lucius]|uniref:Barrier-to-autointegration factor 1 n=1 Tax=Esox lucius TaxID=8010 RepID=A0AAY5KV99_ESOLU|nr:barrier-to-autointegration factor B [Esox lucius]
MSGNHKGSNPPPTTSQKHRNFVSEPMGNRSVRDVPGIGSAQGRRLEEKGVARADQMLGQYLVSGRDQDRFQNYLKGASGANAKQQRDAYHGMKEWTENNM